MAVACGTQPVRSSGARGEGDAGVPRVPRGKQAGTLLALRAGGCGLRFACGAVLLPGAILRLSGREHRRVARVSFGPCGRARLEDRVRFFLLRGRRSLAALLLLVLVSVSLPPLFAVALVAGGALLGTAVLFLVGFFGAATTAAGSLLGLRRIAHRIGDTLRNLT